MRYLITLLDILGGTLTVGGLCLLASLAHPYLAVAVAGVCLLVLATALAPGRGGRS